MSVYIYTRVSTSQQADNGQSLDVQERQARAYAEAHGVIVDRMFTDRGVSGSKPFGDRPEGAKLLRALKDGDAVIATKLDRMFRSALDALKMLEMLKRRNISLHLIDLGGDVTGNGIAGLFMTIASAFAEFERNRTQERIREVIADKRARGMRLGGTLPYGFQVDAEGHLLPDPEKQQHIKTIRALRAQGMSLRAIADEVNAHGADISHMGVKAVLERAQCA